MTREELKALADRLHEISNTIWRTWQLDPVQHEAYSVDQAVTILHKLAELEPKIVRPYLGTSDGTVLYDLKGILDDHET